MNTRRKRRIRRKLPVTANMDMSEMPEISLFMWSNHYWTSVLQFASKHPSLPKTRLSQVSLNYLDIYVQIHRLAEHTDRFDVLLPVIHYGHLNCGYWWWFNWWSAYLSSHQNSMHLIRRDLAKGREEAWRPSGDWSEIQDGTPFPGSGKIDKVFKRIYSDLAIWVKPVAPVDYAEDCGSVLPEPAFV